MASHSLSVWDDFVEHTYHERWEKVKVLVAQSCLALFDPVDCTPPGSSVRGIFQARILEWVAILFSRGSSQPRNRTWVFCTAGRLFTIWATKEAQLSWLGAVESHQEEGWGSSATVAPHRCILSLLLPHQRRKQLAEEGYPLRCFHLCSSLFSRVWRVRQDRGYLGCRRRLPEALLEGTNASVR